MFHLQRNRVPEYNGAKSDGLDEDSAREARQGFQFSRNLFAFLLERNFYFLPVRILIRVDLALL